MRRWVRRGASVAAAIPRYMEEKTDRILERGRRPGTGAVWGMAGGMVAVAALVHAGLVPSTAVADAPYLIPWWALAIAFAVFEMAVVRLNVRTEAHTVTLSDVPLVLGLLLASPFALIVGRLAGSAVALIYRRRGRLRVSFNLALYYLEIVVAVAFLRGLLGEGGGASLGAWMLVLAAHIITVGLGASMVAAAVRVTDRRRTLGEVARSMLSGLGISLGAGIVSLLFLIAAWGNPWALVVIAVVMALIYGALRLFDSLSDRHKELRSVHAFTTSINSQESAAVSEATLQDLAASFRVGVVEIAALHGVGDGRRWIYARLDDGYFGIRPHDRDGLESLIDGVARLGVVSLKDTDPEMARLLAGRGLGEGLLNGFQVGDLSGFIVVGNKTPAGRNGWLDRSLFETLTTQMVANLERVALVERLRLEIEIKEHQRLHDGLLTRTGFTERLQATLQGGSDRAAVAVVDLDHFQDFNDVFGPEQGDALLVEVGKRLSAGIRSSDVLARIGGDEFGVLFNEVRGVDATVALTRRIGDAFTAPFIMGEAKLTLAASTGLAIYPDHGADADTLLRRADMAKSIAKIARGTVEIFDLEQDVEAERRLVLANDLRRAIEVGEIGVNYQPKLEMASGRTIGFEALARWTHAELGPISPLEFIGLADHSGVITPLTFGVLEEALTDAARWRRSDSSLSVSVNIAASVLSGDDFADRVQEALARHDLPTDALVLEITESETLAEDRGAQDTVLRLAAAGIMVSIDDFGTGYSALSYLQNLPVGEVKIDRSFVARMAEHPGDRAIVTGTIQLLHSLGLQVVAEGVETVAVWDLLAELGCRAAQGYLMSRPLSPEDAEAWAVSPGWSLEEIASR